MKVQQESEEFFTCAWTINRETGSLILLLGGQKRFVRAVDLNEGNSVHVLEPLCSTLTPLLVMTNTPYLTKSV